jgi:hypothetical protein
MFSDPVHNLVYNQVGNLRECSALVAAAAFNQGGNPAAPDVHAPVAIDCSWVRQVVEQTDLRGIDRWGYPAYRFSCPDARCPYQFLHCDAFHVLPLHSLFDYVENAAHFFVNCRIAGCYRLLECRDCSLADVYKRIGGCISYINIFIV